MESQTEGEDEICNWNSGLLVLRESGKTDGLNIIGCSVKFGSKGLQTQGSSTNMISEIVSEEIPGALACNAVH